MTMIDSREYAGWMNAKRADKARDKVKKKKDDIFKMKKWDSMAADPHIFVPMASIGKMDEKGSDGKKKPTHVMDIITRGQFISRTLNDKWKTGGVGVSYRAYFWGIICFALTVISFLYIHIYVAAVFAYLTGFMRSQYLIQHAWSVEWFKGKPLIASA